MRTRKRIRARGRAARRSAWLALQVRARKMIHGIDSLVITKLVSDTQREIQCAWGYQVTKERR